MKTRYYLIPLLAVLLITGCVSSGKYKASLAEIDNFKKDVSSLEDKLKAKESEKAMLEGVLAALKTNSAALEEKLKVIEAEKKKLEEDLVLLKNECDDLSAKKKALEGENANLNRLLEAKKDELTKEVVSLKEKLSGSEHQVEELKTGVRAKESQVSEIKGETENLRNEIRSKDMQVAELRTAIEGLSKEKSKAIEEKEKAIAEFRKTHDSLVSELNTEIKKGEIAITQLRDKLSVNMVDKVLFDSGSAEVKKEGKQVLKRVGDILKKVADKQIKVEGHTDNVPISQKLMVKFPSNWELSSARATNVAKYLQDSAGLDPKLLTVAGYSEYRPIESNDTLEGRAKNRRIEIVLIPLDIDRITKGP
ncbi:MAG: OmpA family protein [Nitrospirae bacterium]|nr:OmpA family protein [Nitrospirota bacterium]